MNNVLILSANSDMAVACARTYADAGYPLILAGRDINALEALANDLRIRFRQSVSCLQFDALNTQSHQFFMEQVLTLGKLEGVLVFTGYLGDQKKAQNDFSEASIIMQSNFSSLVSILEKIATYFEKQQLGFVVGVSSVAGDRGRQSNYIYGASKAAFTAYLSGLRNRLFKSHVHVLTVKPGFVNTRMTENMNLSPLLTAQPEQVAQAIFKAQQKSKNVIYVKPIWALVMLVIRYLPENIFKRTNL